VELLLKPGTQGEAWMTGRDGYRTWGDGVLQ